MTRRRAHNFVDLSGSAIGAWSVGADNRRSSSGKTEWECTCRCGAVRWVPTGNLRRGKSRGCRNCGQKGKRNFNFKDLAGHVFGRWTAVSFKQGRWLCVCSCGKVARVLTGSLVAGASRSCGCLKLEQARGRCGPLSPYWKGGSVTKRGYVVATVSGRKTPLHRRVMEAHLGRMLLPTEVVHHIDGDRRNNAIANLELWSVSHPPGQRISDKLRWAREFIALYEGQPV